MDAEARKKMTKHKHKSIKPTSPFEHHLQMTRYHSLTFALLLAWSATGNEAFVLSPQTTGFSPSLGVVLLPTQNRLWKRLSQPSTLISSSHMALHAATTDSDSSPLPFPEEEKVETSNRALLVWVHLVSIFVAGNYFRPMLWPGFLLDVPAPVWNLVHALSAMMFAGGVFTTTILEWNIPKVKTDDDSNNVLKWLWQVESQVVLPGVTGSLISGVVQAHQRYATLRYAPIHVKSALHAMFLFGIWWAWTDLRSQKEIRQSGFVPEKVTRRRLSNVVSCCFLIALYGIMILKPGYHL